MRGRWILGGLIGGGVLFGVLQYNYSLLGEWRYRAMEAHLVDADDESSGSARDLVDREEIENRLDGDVVLFGPQGSGKSFLVQKNNKRSMILDLHKIMERVEEFKDADQIWMEIENGLGLHGLDRVKWMWSTYGMNWKEKMEFLMRSYRRESGNSSFAVDGVDGYKVELVDPSKMQCFMEFWSAFAEQINQLRKEDAEEGINAFRLLLGSRSSAFPTNALKQLIEKVFGSDRQEIWVGIIGKEQALTFVKSHLQKSSSDNAQHDEEFRSNASQLVVQKLGSNIGKLATFLSAHSFDSIDEIELALQAEKKLLVDSYKKKYFAYSLMEGLRAQDKSSDITESLPFSESLALWNVGSILLLKKSHVMSLRDIQRFSHFHESEEVFLLLASNTLILHPNDHTLTSLPEIESSKIGFPDELHFEAFAEIHQDEKISEKMGILLMHRDYLFRKEQYEKDFMEYERSMQKMQVMKDYLERKRPELSNDDYIASFIEMDSREQVLITKGNELEQRKRKLYDRGLYLEERIKSFNLSS